MASAQVARVYAQDGTSAPIYAYNSSSTGKLTTISGSPFKETIGLLVGTNGTHLITMGNWYVHSYKVSSTGALGAQVSEINTQLYLPAGTGSAFNAELDPTGAYVYVMFNTSCCDVDILTFEVSTSGALTFKGSTSKGQVYGGPPAVTGNNKFAYALTLDAGQFLDFSLAAFSRESTGVLNAISASETNPTPGPAGTYSIMSDAASDPTNHLAVVVMPYNGTIVNGAIIGYGPQQLASYTVGTQGDTVSTNTWADMPMLPLQYGTSMAILRINQTGKILAAGAGPGVQFFHFNGAAPITTFTGIIGTSGFISTMGWDKDNHLYALNAASGKLHVYTVTSTKVVEAPGSPYSNIPYCGGCQQTLVVR